MDTRATKEDLPDKAHNKTMYIDRELIDAVDYLPIEQLCGYRRHARRHPKRQRRLIERSIREFGFVVPIIADRAGSVIAGHLRLIAAHALGYKRVPVIRIDHLTDEQVRALRLADNRLAELGEWDDEILAHEFQGLIDLDYDVEMTGFQMAEVDLTIGAAFSVEAEDKADDLPEVELRTVSQMADRWKLDEHLVICGDARYSVSYEALLGGRRAQMMITDPPYNVKINGNVGGKGRIKHGEFVMASGEMSDAEFEDFLRAFVSNAVRFSEAGSLHYLFIDWRHYQVLARVCTDLYDTQLNMCVWVKSNGGMGSLYRSRHELVLVFRNGPDPHINNVELGRYGRNRTNVWEYHGCSSGTRDRRADLSLHPTVKPAEMIADAIKDASKRGGVILDPFLGSGTTIIACEMTGRVGVGLERDPRYVDVVVRRWQAYTGGEAVHAETSLTFAQMEDMRAGKLLLAAPADEGV